MLSQGFVTRDGIKPTEFRQIAHMEISRYPTVEYKNTEVISVIKNQMIFELVTSMGEKYQSKTIIISTGLKDILSSIDNISSFRFLISYGFMNSKSLVFHNLMSIR